MGALDNFLAVAGPTRTWGALHGYIQPANGKHKSPWQDRCWERGVGMSKHIVFVLAESYEPENCINGSMLIGGACRSPPSH